MNMFSEMKEFWDNDEFWDQVLIGYTNITGELVDFSGHNGEMDGESCANMADTLTNAVE